MKPTGSQFGAALVEFGTRVWDEVARKPGADLDDVDREAWRAQCRRLTDPMKRTPSDLATWTEAGHLWSAGVWRVFFGLRNAKYRPTWAEVGGLFEAHLGVPSAFSEPVSGADAEARTIRTAPPLPPVAELPAGPTDGSYRPPWLDDYRRMISRDNGGPFDVQMISYLSKMSDAAAGDCIRQMHAENLEASAVKARAAVDGAHKIAAARQGRGGRDAVEMVARELRQLNLIDVQAAQPAPTPKEHWADQ